MKSSVAANRPAMPLEINWAYVYTTAVSLVGGFILLLAIVILPKNLPGLAVFALMVMISELSSVQLFHSTRNSTVSVSMIITVAAIFCLGPSAGVLLQVVTALMNTLATHLKEKGSKTVGNTSMFRRWAFNTGMFVLATATAGYVYMVSGGTVGDLRRVDSILPLILAVITDTMVNVGLLMVIISLQTKAPIRSIWREDIQWGVPICIVGEAIGGGALALAYQLNGILGASVFFVPIFAISYSFRTYANNLRGTMNQLEQVNNELHENTIDLFETLSAVIDAYDIYTRRHSAFVAEYVGAIAEQMGLPTAEQAKIIKAALVHDIGKIGISDAIIGKNGPLTQEEFAILKRHPSIGADILKRMKGFQDLVPLVLSHQEKFDGTGYPEGLKGEAIPLGARVITLADSVEAMLSDRAYRQGYPLERVVDEVRRCSGTHFDPQVAQAFLVVAAEKGTALFRNSALAVDHDITIRMSEHSGSILRFRKRSLVEAA